MVFDSRKPLPAPADAGEPGSRFSESRQDLAFRRVTCFRCDHTAVYRYQVRQVRRRPEILTSEDEQVRDDHLEMWRSVPRFAEIPETVRCRNCGEILGLYTECIY